MTLIRYNPLHELDSLQRQMNQLFDEVFLPSDGQNRQTINPVAELTETDDSYVLKLELPGMNIDDLDIQATKDSVSITGERQDTHNHETDGYRRTEFRYGKFQRVVPIPAGIQNTKVSAEYKDGILVLNLPKAEEAKNKVVKVLLNK